MNAILVIDMPDKCPNCQFWSDAEHEDGFGYLGLPGCILTEKPTELEAWNKRASDCPLQPISEKQVEKIKNR